MEAANDNYADLLVGASAIAQHLGLTRRQVYHHLQHGRIPTFKLGASVVASRRRLAEWQSEMMRAA